jgi:hypothetical protein
MRKNWSNRAQSGAANAIPPIPRPPPRNATKLVESRSFGRSHRHSADPAPAAPQCEKTGRIALIRPQPPPFRRSRARRAAMRKNWSNRAHSAAATAIPPIPRLPRRNAKKLVESRSFGRSHRHSADPARAAPQSKIWSNRAHLDAATAIPPIPRPPRRNAKKLVESRSFGCSHRHSADPAPAAPRCEKTGRIALIWTQPPPFRRSRARRAAIQNLVESRSFGRSHRHSADPAPPAPQCEQTGRIALIRPQPPPFRRSRACPAAMRKNWSNRAHSAAATAIPPNPRLPRPSPRIQVD